MGGRLARCAGSGLLVLGLATGMLAGAGLAFAEPDSGTGASSESAPNDANSTGAQSDSKPASGDKTTKPDTTDGVTTAATTSTTIKTTSTKTTPDPPEATIEPADTDTTVAKTTAKTTTEPTATETPATESTKPTASETATATTQAKKPVETTKAAVATQQPSATAEVVEPAKATAEPEPLAGATIAAPAAEPTPAVAPLATAATKTTQSTPVETQPAKLLAAATPMPTSVPTGPSLINVLGTIAFAVFDFVTKLFEGPPAVPPGSTVAVGRSTLNIDCGDDTAVEADWYFPTGNGAPTGLAYFQHGFGATAGFYNYTAATLAQETNSIVVAPSISSNLFDCFGCSQAGAAMQQAVADLFTGDRAELTRSARVASGDPNLVLPDRMVVSGHSTGGSTALGIAGDLAANAETAPDLAGVMLFDSSPMFGGIGTADVLAKIPDSIPVLNIAGEPSFWDSYGELNAALEAARPGQFNGVEVIGGSHSDAFQTSNPLIQLVVYLGTGFSAPQNVAANFDLAGGWIDDMFAGTVDDPTERTGIYGDPGTTIDIPTGPGTASAYVLPGPPVQLGLLDALIKLGVDWLGGTNFATCAADPAEMQSPSGVAPAKLSTRNTALSLDGRPQTGQSVGQHVCTGDGLPASIG